MSNALTQLVPVFDGANWLIWSESIKSYLMAQGQWYVLTQTRPEEPASAATEWDADNLKARETEHLAKRFEGGEAKAA